MNFGEILKIILTPLLCAVLIVATKMSIEYYPLSFGIVIALVNWKRHKFNPIFGIFLSVVVSYICFFMAYFSLILLSTLLQPLLGEDKGDMIAMTTSPFLIAPILVFLLYKFVFIYNKSRIRSYIIILSSIFLLVTIFSLHSWYFEKTQFKFDFNELLNPYTLWQVITAFAIQLIVYQKPQKKIDS